MQALVKITSPEHAGRAKGPEVTITWEAPPAMLQEISIDGAAFKPIGADDRSFTAEGLSEGVHTASIRVERGHGLLEASSTFYVYIPAQLSPSKLYILDLTHLRSVDVSDPKQAADAFGTLHCAAVLQGLANRDKPQLYINYMDVDPFWLDMVRSKGAYLQHTELAKISGIEEALAVFAQYARGAVVWDPDVPSTSNVASTICGVENLIPIRYDSRPDSLYGRLISGGPKLPVVHNLVGCFGKPGKINSTNINSTGSAKCDSYLWAKAHYLDTGRCNPAEIGYWCDSFWLNHPQDMSLDNVGLSNHDFVIARKGFFCDLHVWDDEAPRDDPGQRHGLDRETFCDILLSCHKSNKGQMIHFSGFTPWAMKYTDHHNAGGKHGGVATEWEMTRITSSYNAYVDADAIGYVGMANASVFQHCPLPDRLVQNRPPTKRELQEKGYIDSNGSVARKNFIYHYLGDYDSAAWLYHRMPAVWQSPARGHVPSGWAFNPNLIERLPVLFDWVYQTKSPEDYFVAGDSGAGYVNPTALFPPRPFGGLPSGADDWIRHNVPYFRRLNYSIVGFIINAFCGELTDESNRMYTSFSGDGVMTQVWMPKDKKQDHLLDNMPVAHMERDIDGTPEQAAGMIVPHGQPGNTAFLGFRSILKDPEWIRAVNEAAQKVKPECNFTPVDPYTYFYLLRHHLGGANDMRGTYTFDTMPGEIRAGQPLTITVGLRNDGWDDWSRNQVELTARFGSRDESVHFKLPADVTSGGSAVVEITLTAPTAPGAYEFTLELRKGADGWFGDSGDLPWAKRVCVV